MFVYTFWEPRENMPVYLQLCIETWKKFLPNATIIILDYKNIGEFIDVRELGLNLFSDRRINLAHISDAVRVALLAKHGGVWLDADTIILSPDAEKYFLPDQKHRTIIFGDINGTFCQMCFINTPPNSMCMSLWREAIREKIWNLNSAPNVSWGFIGNEFIDEYAKAHPEEFVKIDKLIAMPHKAYHTDFSRTSTPEYIKYFFLDNYHRKDISNPMLFLQNSWTPPLFKQVSSQDFFRFDCTLVNVLAEALEIKLPPPESFQTCYWESKLKSLLAALPKRRAAFFLTLSAFYINLEKNSKRRKNS